MLISTQVLTMSSPAASLWHLDWGACARRGAAFTALTPLSGPMWKSTFYGAFVLNRRVVLPDIDATPARWRGDAGSSPLDGAPDTRIDFHTDKDKG